MLSIKILVPTKKITMKLEIARTHDEVDVYDVDDKCTLLSQVLAQFVNDDTNVIRLPVHFEDMFMRIIEKYLNHFSKESLPLKLPMPLSDKSTQDILDPFIHEWVQELTLNELAKLRQVAMYFDLTPLIDQIDAILAIAIIQNPKEVFKTFHEPNLTMASKECVVEKFPILN